MKGKLTILLYLKLKGLNLTLSNIIQSAADEIDNVVVKKRESQSLINAMNIIVAKGEIADHKQVVLFSTMFSYASTK